MRTLRPDIRRMMTSDEVFIQMLGLSGVRWEANGVFGQPTSLLWKLLEAVDWHEKDARKHLSPA